MISSFAIIPVMPIVSASPASGEFAATPISHPLTHPGFVRVDPRFVSLNCMTGFPPGFSLFAEGAGGAQVASGANGAGGGDEMKKPTEAQLKAFFDALGEGAWEKFQQNRRLLGRDYDVLISEITSIAKERGCYFLFLPYLCVRRFSWRDDARWGKIHAQIQRAICYTVPRYLDKFNRFYSAISREPSPDCQIISDEEFRSKLLLRLCQNSSNHFAFKSARSTLLAIERWKNEIMREASKRAKADAEALAKASAVDAYSGITFQKIPWDDLLRRCKNLLGDKAVDALRRNTKSLYVPRTLGTEESAPNATHALLSLITAMWSDEDVIDRDMGLRPRRRPLLFPFLALSLLDQLAADYAVRPALSADSVEGSPRFTAEEAFKAVKPFYALYQRIWKEMMRAYNGARSPENLDELAESLLKALYQNRPTDDATAIRDLARVLVR